LCAKHCLYGFFCFYCKEIFISKNGGPDTSFSEIEAKGIFFSYASADRVLPALSNININIEKGQTLAILGQNGCGKSTFARLCNALLPLQEGSLTVAGYSVRNPQTVRQLRRLCGMVFQNPANQFVSPVAAEDIAFGLENYGEERLFIEEKVKNILTLLNIEKFADRNTNTLSGGEKQRVALACVLALDPSIIIFDEVTAMLDPLGRDEILASIKKLRKEQNKTIIMITHYVEEVVDADRVCLMQNGEIIADSTPRNILTDLNLMAKAGLSVPLSVRLYYDLKKCGIVMRRPPLSNEELAEELCSLS
jgi:energy-coupling factor transport system ATP-binding protein